MLDHFSNISMTLSGTSCLIDVDRLLADDSVMPAFDGEPEACGKACMDWYAEYYLVDYPHGDETDVRGMNKGVRGKRNVVFDLQGRRVYGPLRKGVYVIDGQLKLKN